MSTGYQIIAIRSLIDCVYVALSNNQPKKNVSNSVKYSQIVPGCILSQPIARYIRRIWRDVASAGINIV